MNSLIVKVDRNNLIGNSETNKMPRENINISDDIKEANSLDYKRFIALRK